MMAVDKVSNYSASPTLFELGGTQQIGDQPKKDLLSTTSVSKQQERTSGIYCTGGCEGRGYQQVQRGLDVFMDNRSVSRQYNQQAWMHSLTSFMQQLWMVGKYKGKGPQSGQGCMLFPNSVYYCHCGGQHIG